MAIFTDLEIKAFIRDFIKNSDNEDWINQKDLLELYILKINNRREDKK